MKKVLSLVLILLFIIPLASCGEKVETTLTFDEFEAKYKRADFNAFSYDPTEFIQDFTKISYSKSDNLTPYSFLLTWDKDSTEEDEDFTTITYKKSGILFNRSVIFAASIIESHAGGIMCLIFLQFDTGNKSETFRLAKKITEKAFDLYGDAESISVNAVEADEAAFRKALNQDDITVFDITFKNISVVYYSTGSLYLH